MRAQQYIQILKPQWRRCRFFPLVRPSKLSADYRPATDACDTPTRDVSKLVTWSVYFMGKWTEEYTGHVTSLLLHAFYCRISQKVGVN